MANNIKGLTVQIGGDATELGKALKDIQSKSSAASKELSQINKLLKLDPGNTDLLAQKQAVLAEKISATRQKLEILKQAQEAASKAFAEKKISESEYRQIERDAIAARQELEGLEKQAKETGDALNSSGKKGAEGAKKTADAEKDVGSEAKEAESKVSSFGDVLKGSLAAQAIVSGLRAIKNGVKGLYSAVTESANALGALSDDAERVGVSAESLQAWQYAAKMVGIENDKLFDALKTQQTAFANAKNGSDDLVESYAAIGINIKTISSSEAAFEAAISALSECADENERNAIANKLFGESYVHLVPLLNMGAEKIAAARQEAHDLGLVISNESVIAGDEFADTMATIGLQVDAAKAKLVSGMVPALQKFSSTMEQKLASPQAQKQLEKTGKALGDLAVKSLDLATKVLPVLADVLYIVTNHGKKVAIAAGAAVVAFKGFTIVNTLKKTLNAAKTAFLGLNAAMSANPIGAVITAISALISILSLLSISDKKAVDHQRQLAEAYQYVTDAADAALEAQRKRAQGALAIQDEYDTYRDLVKELYSLVDAEGRVMEGNEARVNYILNELSSATGTEIELVDGVIQKYDELSDSIDEVLLKQQAEKYMTSNQGDYDTAKNTIYSLETDEKGNYVVGSQAAAEQLENQLKTYRELMVKYKIEMNMRVRALDSGNFDQQLEAGIEMDRILQQFGHGVTNIHDMQEVIAAAQDVADSAVYAYDQNVAMIEQYEGVQTAVWTDDAEAITLALESAANVRMSAANATLSSLEKQRDAAIDEYNQYVEWVKQDGSTVTQEQVRQKANAAVAAAMEAHIKMIAEGDMHTQEEIDASREQLTELMKSLTFESDEQITKLLEKIEKDACTAGSDYVDGIIKGLTDNAHDAYRAAHDLGEEVNRGYADATQTRSPSRTARRAAAWYPVGLALGIRDNENQPVEAVRHMAQKLDAAVRGDFSAPALEFGAWGGNITRHDKNGIAGTPADLSGILDRMERILSAVQQIDPNIYLDGRKVSDSLTGYNDANLGQLAMQQQRGSMQ